MTKLDGDERVRINTSLQIAFIAELVYSRDYERFVVIVLTRDTNRGRVRPRALACRRQRCARACRRRAARVSNFFFSLVSFVCVFSYFFSPFIDQKSEESRSQTNNHARAPYSTLQGGDKQEKTNGANVAHARGRRSCCNKAKRMQTGGHLDANRECSIRAPRSFATKKSARLARSTFAAIAAFQSARANLSAYERARAHSHRNKQRCARFNGQRARASAIKKCEN